MHKKVKIALWIAGLFLLNLGVAMLSEYDPELSILPLFLFLIIAGFVFLASVVRLVWVALCRAKRNTQNNEGKVPSASVPSQHSKKKVALWIISSFFFILLNMHAVYVTAGLHCPGLNYFARVYYFYTYDLLGIGEDPRALGVCPSNANQVGI